MENVLLKIQNLKKYYTVGKRTVKALEDVTFDIYKGEVISLLGVNGAGKTTLSSILVTLHPATSGDILLNGESIYKDVNEFRKIIGYCPQKPNVIRDLTVEQNLTFAGMYYGFSKQEVKQRVDELIKKYDLCKYRHMKPYVLSGGYMRRLLIARSLMSNPKILILDEPTVGLDSNVRRKIWENIKDLKNLGVTVILTSHYLDEIEVLSDRVVLLHKGRVKLIDTPKNLMRDFKKSRLEDVFVQLIEEEA
ncbi:MAG: Daunorubicin resistance ABC transporter ATPase subunit [candidate division TM6 bacterium GW2011_GWF2_30_66]|jgi:ABC-2 type transport system ATP-binding protein|nr:MAG: Daunorubicin resistance ABC transporter ATPase subunit [candidate division TM6 bacterium GW2011_GWF2_30_66]